jgi:hypothetical protein
LGWEELRLGSNGGAVRASSPGGIRIRSETLLSRLSQSCGMVFFERYGRFEDEGAG